MADIEVVIQNKLAVVTLNRPEQRNAMTLAMWRSVSDVFKQLGGDAAIRGIILTGAGGNFSVGADVAEFAKVRSNPKESKEYEIAVDQASDAIATAPKPVIAVLEGYCLGGGCHLSMACDFRYAHPESSIGIPAAKLSIVYGVRSTQRLLALVGLLNAKRILYAAERFSVDDAPKGLIDRVSSDPMADARTFLEKVALLAPISIAGAKQILTEISMGLGTLDVKAADALIDLASGSDDYEEGRKAFAEKRPPMFRGT